MRDVAEMFHSDGYGMKPEHSACNGVQAATKDGAEP